MSLIKEKQPPYRRVLYNRTGNLATQTKLDQGSADQFMRVTDMRRDIVIVDSDKPPRNSILKVGDDVLAFKIIEPISRISAEVFRSQRYHSLVRDDDIVKVQVLERQIDADVRATHCIDRSDYNSKFLEGINRAVKDGLSAALFHEKLGFKDQGISLLAYFLFMGPIFEQNIEAFMRNGEMSDPLRTIGFFFGTNLFVHFGMRLALLERKYNDSLSKEDKEFDLKRLPFLRGDWKEAILPVMPVDRWLRGRAYLAKPGEDLVIPR